MWGESYRKAFLIIPYILVFWGTAIAITIRIPEDSPTIQGGIEMAQDGDTVLVSSGTYPENIDFLGKAIVVKSESGCLTTTIESPDSGSVVSFISNESLSSVLEGFTLTGGMGTGDDYYQGQADFGGGIFIKGASPTIQGNKIVWNAVFQSCASYGGGIAIKDSSNPVIIQNTITNNLVGGPCDWINYFGGGIWVDSTSNPTIGGSEFNGNNIYDNWADYGWQLYREGSGQIIDAQYNYWGACPPDSYDIYPLGEFDFSNYSDSLIITGFGLSKNNGIPAGFKLFQNYPNPFNTTTTIEYRIIEDGLVSLEIYNLLGQVVKTLVNSPQHAREYRVIWDGRDDYGKGAASGVYFCQLKTGGMVQTRKMVLSR